MLRKVASLTFEKAAMEQKVHKPKFVPEKLDFQMYEKFEGSSQISYRFSSLPPSTNTQFSLCKDSTILSGINGNIFSATSLLDIGRSQFPYT